MKFIERTKDAFSKIRFLDQYMEGHSGFIAGGCFKNIFKDEKIKDVDIFFPDAAAFSKACEWFESDENYVFSYENNNTMSFKNKWTGIRVELIQHTYGTPEEILSMFDFSITKFAYAKRQDLEGVTYYPLYVDTFFEDLTSNKLVIDGELKFPVSSFERSYRYRSYGYGLCKESKAKLIEALRTANVDNLSNDLYFGID